MPAVTELTDEQLVEHIREGGAARQAAFAELYRRLCPSVLGWTRRMVRDGETAEDLAQETFLRLYLRPPPRLLVGAGAARAYVRTIAWNLARDWHRKRRTEPLPTDLGASQQALSETLVEAEELEQVNAALAGLAAPFREVVELQLAGLSLAEIAAQLDLPLGTVSSRLNRAREQLKKLLRVEDTTTEQ